MDKILWRDHSNESFSAVLLHGTIYFSIFYKMIFGIFLFLALLGVERVKMKSLSEADFFIMAVEEGESW